MSHVLEQYLHPESNTELQENMQFSVLETVMNTAPKLIEDMQNYDHRATIMLSGTVALNQSLQMGVRGDWASHNIEHAVSAVYDIPHAGGLAILFPNLMRHNLDVNVDKFKRLAVKVLGVSEEGKSDRDIALEGIDKLSAFWSSLGAPNRLADYDIDDSQLDLIADRAMANGAFGNFKSLERDDVMAILKASL